MARTRSAASDHTKQRLADSALALFHRRGYHGTSVQDIVSAAGAPKGTFYNHFVSKEALAVDAVERYCAAIPLEMLDSAAGGTPLERIAAHLHRVVEITWTWYDRGCLLGNLATEMPAHSKVVSQAVADGLARWISALARAIEEARAAGELGFDGSPADLAAFIIDSYEGAAARSKVTGTSGPMRLFLDTTLTRVLV
ncbi:TetR/AcrR family transcriptional regulator [Micromonospora sp. NPDC049559]|uniref:TetR/AcrR family transcriptional regulator n=1 Tax=Micromonospora sp. NPDC049559 TaxID=3155923 RepID=UPI00344A8AA6